MKDSIDIQRRQVTRHLSNHTVEENRPLMPSPSPASKSFTCCQSICMSSKAAVLVVILAVIVGALHAVFTCTAAITVFTLIRPSEYVSEPVIIVLPYLVMTVASYPVSSQWILC